MRVLITGVAGFIGSTTAHRLLARGDDVVGIDSINDYYDPQLKRDRLARLKAASEDVKAKVFANMSERAAESLKEEIEFMGPVRVRDVEATHMRIIETLRKLEEAGELIIAGRAADDDFIS